MMNHRDDVLKFKDFKKKMQCPFVIVCDFETINRNVVT